MRVAEYPGLYDPTADTPQLRGNQCSSCGRVYFPPISIGCEACGAEEPALVACDLPAVGRIHSIADVQVQRGSHPVPPFVVAEVSHPAGPLFRVMLAYPTNLRIGQEVAAVWSSATNDDGDEVVAPLFEAADTGRNA
jgi:uncharacterized protein